MHGLKIIYNIIQGYFVQEVVWPVIPVHYEQSTQKCLKLCNLKARPSLWGCDHLQLLTTVRRY